ncbi:MAG TPA: hypothetical protein VL357_01645 [Rariglobus sp.]|nr:hypothetical protein [Rariglobus sp.]
MDSSQRSWKINPRNNVRILKAMSDQPIAGISVARLEELYALGMPRPPRSAEAAIAFDLAARAMAAAAPISISRTAFVDLSGDDETAAIGNPALPYLTAQAAYGALAAANVIDAYQYALHLGVNSGSWSIDLSADWNTAIFVTGKGDRLSKLLITGIGANGANGANGTDTALDNEYAGAAGSGLPGSASPSVNLFSDKTVEISVTLTGGNGGNGGAGGNATGENSYGGNGGDGGQGGASGVLSLTNAILGEIRLTGGDAGYSGAGGAGTQANGNDGYGGNGGSGQLATIENCIQNGVFVANGGVGSYPASFGGNSTNIRARNSVFYNAVTLEAGDGPSYGLYGDIFLDGCYAPNLSGMRDIWLSGSAYQFYACENFHDMSIDGTTGGESPSSNRVIPGYPF